jgi:c-di-GMP-binding flagellar brake protein YcgR
MEVELATRVIHTSTDESEPISPIFISTRTINLSGGGFAIYHPNALPTGTLLDVKLKIAEHGEPLNVTAKVARSKPLDAPIGEFTHEIGFAFVELTEVVRCQVMSHMIRLQQASVLRDCPLDV